MKNENNPWIIGLFLIAGFILGIKFQENIGPRFRIISGPANTGVYMIDGSNGRAYLLRGDRVYRLQDLEFAQDSQQIEVDRIVARASEKLNTQGTPTMAQMDAAIDSAVATPDPKPFDPDAFLAAPTPARKSF